MSGFSHPNFGNEIRIEVQDNEVRLIFVAKSTGMANDFAETLIAQAREGAFHITMKGRPTSIVETET